jgi:hypothetical protein
MGKWNSMESAPHDGTAVEVKFRNGEKLVLWWDNHWRMWRNAETFYHNPMQWRKSHVLTLTRATGSNEPSDTWSGI